MQISINQDQIRHLQNRFFKNINDVAKNEYEKASWYLSLRKLVGQEGFAGFLTQYFNYTIEQVHEGEEQMNYVRMFSSRRLWMRVGGLKGIKKLYNITDEVNRNEVVNRINQPKGIVNYTLADLDQLIEGDAVDSENVKFFNSYTRPRDESRKKRSHKREPKQNELLVKLTKSLDALTRNSKPKSKRKRRRKHNRQPVMSS